MCPHPIPSRIASTTRSLPVDKVIVLQLLNLVRDSNPCIPKEDGLQPPAIAALPTRHVIIRLSADNTALKCTGQTSSRLRVVLPLLDYQGPCVGAEGFEPPMP